MPSGVTGNMYRNRIPLPAFSVMYSPNPLPDRLEVFREGPGPVPHLVHGLREEPVERDGGVPRGRLGDDLDEPLLVELRHRRVDAGPRDPRVRGDLGRRRGPEVEQGEVHARLILREPVVHELPDALRVDRQRHPRTGRPDKYVVTVASDTRPVAPGDQELRPGDTSSSSRKAFKGSGITWAPVACRLVLRRHSMGSIVREILTRATEEAAPREAATLIYGADDTELERILSGLRTNIKIFGVGGGGSNTIDRLVEAGIVGAGLYPADTAAPHPPLVRAPPT